eukprot:4923239-Prymnesium_polylepis.1
MAARVVQLWPEPLSQGGGGTRLIHCEGWDAAASYLPEPQSAWRPPVSMRFTDQCSYILDARRCRHLARLSLAVVTGEAEAIVSGVLRRKTVLAGGEHRG